MKAVSAGFFLIVAIIIGIVIVLISSQILTNMSTSKPNAPAGITSGHIKKTVYDYSNLLLPPDEEKWPYPYIDSVAGFQEYLDGERFCSSLYNCIQRSIFTGVPCEVDGVAFGEMTSPTTDYSAPLGCAGDVEYSIASGLKQKLCTVDPTRMIGYASLPKNSLDMSDANGLSFDNCRLVDGTYGLGSISTNEGWDVSYYSNDRGYVGISSKFNGPGRMKIVMDRATVAANGECSFNLLFCPFPSIATNEADGSIYVFDITRDLDFNKIYSADDYWWLNNRTGETKTTHDLQNQNASERNVLYYNSWNLVIGKNGEDYWNPLILTNAAKQGLYLGMRQMANASWWTKNWKVASNTQMTYDNCWSDTYDQGIIKEIGAYNLSHAIVYDCGDGFCGPNLTVNAAIRHDWNDTTNVYSVIVSMCDQDA